MIAIMAASAAAFGPLGGLNSDRLNVAVRVERQANNNEEALNYDRCFGSFGRSLWTTRWPER